MAINTIKSQQNKHIKHTKRKQDEKQTRQQANAKAKANRLFRSQPFLPGQSFVSHSSLGLTLLFCAQMPPWTLWKCQLLNDTKASKIFWFLNKMRLLPVMSPRVVVFFKFQVESSSCRCEPGLTGPFSDKVLFWPCWLHGWSRLCAWSRGIERKDESLDGQILAISWNFHGFSQYSLYSNQKNLGLSIDIWSLGWIFSATAQLAHRVAFLQNAEGTALAPFECPTRVFRTKYKNWACFKAHNDGLHLK